MTTNGFSLQKFLKRLSGKKTANLGNLGLEHSTKHFELDISDQGRIFPVLRSGKDVRPSDQGNRETPVVDSFIDNLCISYGIRFDEEEGFQLLAPADCTQLGLRASELMRVAMLNVQQMGEQALVKSVQSVFVVLTDGSCDEASLILDSTFWEQQRRQIHGDVVVAIPARDTMLFTGSMSAPGIETLSETVNHVFREKEHDGNLLLKKLLIRREGTWKILDHYLKAERQQTTEGPRKEENPVSIYRNYEYIEE